MDILFKGPLMILFPSILGMLLLHVLGLRAMPVYAQWAFGYGIGLAGIVVWMMILMALKIKFSLFAVTIPLIVFAVSLIFLTHRARRQSYTGVPPAVFVENPKQGWRPVLELSAVLFILFELFYAFWKTVSVLPYAWDEIWNFSLKGKAFFGAGGADAIATLEARSFQHPLFIPLVQAWNAICLGEWNELLVRSTFPTALVALLLSVYFYLRILVPRLEALLGAALLVSAPFVVLHSTIAYADFFLLYFNTAVILLLSMAFTVSGRYFALAGIFAGLGTLCKTEALAYVFVYYALIVAGSVLYDRKNKNSGAYVFVFVSMGVTLFFYLIKILLTIPMDLVHETAAGLNALGKIAGYVRNLFVVLFLDQTWGAVWFMFVLSVPQIFVNKKSLEARFLLLALGMFFLCYLMFGFSYRSDYIVGERYLGVLNRVVLHSFGLVPILIILLNVSESQSKK